MKRLVEVDDATLKKVLRYEPDTGHFYWIENSGSRRPNVPAGSIVRSGPWIGAIRIGVFNKYYLSHRLAWLYVTGEWPKEMIDHIDRDPSNNRFSNLRLASRSENARNSRCKRTNALGIKGVHLRRDTGKYRAKIYALGKRISLGNFETIEEAKRAYEEAAMHYHGDFACTAAPVRNHG